MTAPELLYTPEEDEAWEALHKKQEAVALHDVEVAVDGVTASRFKVFFESQLPEGMTAARYISERLDEARLP